MSDPFTRKEKRHELFNRMADAFEAARAKAAQNSEDAPAMDPKHHQRRHRAALAEKREARKR